MFEVYTQKDNPTVAFEYYDDYDDFKIDLLNPAVKIGLNVKDWISHIKNSKSTNKNIPFLFTEKTISFEAPSTAGIDEKFSFKLSGKVEFNANGDFLIELKLNLNNIDKSSEYDAAMFSDFTKILSCFIAEISHEDCFKFAPKVIVKNSTLLFSTSGLFDDNSLTEINLLRLIREYEIAIEVIYKSLTLQTPNIQISTTNPNINSKNTRRTKKLNANLVSSELLTAETSPILENGKPISVKIDTPIDYELDPLKPKVRIATNAKKWLEYLKNNGEYNHFLYNRDLYFDKNNFALNVNGIKVTIELFCRIKQNHLSHESKILGRPKYTHEIHCDFILKVDSVENAFSSVNAFNSYANTIIDIFNRVSCSPTQSLFEQRDQHFAFSTRCKDLHDEHSFLINFRNLEIIFEAALGLLGIIPDLDIKFKNPEKDFDDVKFDRDSELSKQLVIRTAPYNFNSSVNSQKEEQKKQVEQREPESTPALGDQENNILNTSGTEEGNTYQNSKIEDKKRVSTPLVLENEKQENQKDDYQDESQSDAVHFNFSTSFSDEVEQLSAIGTKGDHRDLEILKKVLDCVNSDVLKALRMHRYTIYASRDNVTNALENVAGRRIGNAIIDDARGVHKPGTVVATTYMLDGKVILDIAALVHELGHALSEVILNVTPGRGNTSISPNTFDPSIPSRVAMSQVLEHANNKFNTVQIDNLRESLAYAFADEAQNFSEPYFHSPEEFMAQVFAWYFIKPEELKAKFPKTFQAFDAFNMGELIDIQKLGYIQQGMFEKAPISTEPDASTFLEQVEQVNDSREQRSLNRNSVFLELNGDIAAARKLCAQLGRDLVFRRKGRMPFDKLEGFVEVTDFIDQNAKDIFNDIAGSVGTLFFISDPKKFGPSSTFMTHFNDFCKRNDGLCHLVIAGAEKDKKEFTNYMENHVRQKMKILPLTALQLVECIRREAVNDGFEFNAEALNLLINKMNAGGKLSKSKEIWQKIKSKCFLAQGSRAISCDDINKSGVSLEDAALDKFNARIGNKNLKEFIGNFITSFENTEKLEELGVSLQEQSYPRVLLSGNPGTGKTTNVTLIFEAFSDKGILANPELVTTSASELRDLSESQIISLFESGRDGVIFIDEFHQLNPEKNQAGQKIIDALIPVLTNERYAKTVFFAAGYPKPLEELMKVDPGMRSRFTVRVECEDYTQEEQREIAKIELAKSNSLYSENVLNAICERVLKLQRSSQLPGNGRDVEKVVETVVNTKNARVQKTPIAELTREIALTITLEDVVEEVDLKPEDVMQEIEEKVVGNKTIKEFLQNVTSLVERNKTTGRPLHDDIPMTIILDGPAGTGKSSTSELIAKYYHALELITKPDLVVTTGGKMLGAYVGSSSSIAVESKFEDSFGGTLFIDEVSSMVDAMEFSKQAIKTFLLLTQNEPNERLLVIADYDYNIDRFLEFDDGLPRRFKRRLSTEKLTAEDAKKLFYILCKEKGYKVNCSDDNLTSCFSELASLEAFASGADIAELLFSTISDVKATQSRDSVDNEKFDWMLIDDKTLVVTFETAIKEIKRRPVKNNQTKTEISHNLPYETKTEVKTDVQSNKEPTNDNILIDAMQKVNKSFSDIANNEQEKFTEMLKDPQSEYYQELGEALKMSSEKAHEQVKELERRYENDSKNDITSEKIKFDYLCPYCGGLNSSGCGYYTRSEAVNPNSFMFSYGWLIANSMKKPYSSNEF